MSPEVAAAGGGEGGETIGSLSVMDLIRRAEVLAAEGRLPAVALLYTAWIRVHPAEPLLYAVLFNQSVVLSDLGDLAGARAALEQAVTLKPDFAPARINLGRVLERGGDADAAVASWGGVLEAHAGVDGAAVASKVTALVQMARVLEDNDRDAAAEGLLAQVLDLDRDQHEAAQHYLALRQRQCVWPVIAPTERLSHARLLAGFSPLSAAAYADDPWFQLGLAAAYAARDVAVDPDAIITRHWAAADRADDAPLRIGYLSSDLRHHAVGYLMAEVMELHDRRRVEVHAYYCGIPAETDTMQARYRAAADHFVDVAALSLEAAARQIADDGIQILVDVNGYTREGRTKLVALRPAPVIVNWLGYPGTLASPHHHYIVADDWIIPPEYEAYYTERVLRLPCYQPTDRKRAVVAPPENRAAAGLPETGTVFSCFNGSHKITRFVFERWLEILARVPGSVLWLLDGPAGVADRLRARVAGQGIDPARLIFAPKLRNPEHLARLALADLVLDTTPYGAHTTASDALWMGVPVLTASGRSFASRVCGSLVRAAGLPDLVVETAADYVDRAVALGRDPARLAALKVRLLAGRDQSVLFDVPGLVARLEDLFADMWADCRACRLPVPDLANLDRLVGLAGDDHERNETQFAADYDAVWRARIRRHDRARPFARIGRLTRFLD
jgi:predicted O-linked N-acetylglucosamine transferase (SPINDLY family)